MTLNEKRIAAFHAGRNLRRNNKIASLVRLLRYQNAFLDSITTMYLSEQENPYFTSEEEYDQLVLDVRRDINSTTYDLRILREQG